VNAKKTLTVVGGVAVVGLVLALPLAGALAWGVDAGGVNDVKNAGATPALGQIWVGPWVKTYGWTGIDGDLASLRDAGVTPVLLWYYWGDSISPSCVQYGCNGLSFSEWNSMAVTLAQHANSILGGKSFYVVLEPEFNKNGIESWATFDGYLQAQSYSIKANAPAAKTVVGFGSWGNWGLFGGAVAASDLIGFQLLYASTRDSASVASASGDQMVAVATQLHSLWSKPMMVYDFDVASYGGWESVQQAALQNVAARAPQLQSLGVQSVVWRYVRDNTYSSGYFGAAESTWGVMTSTGAPKAGFDELVSLLQGGSTVAPATSVSVSSGASAFSNARGNDWWIEADVAGAPTRVTASVNGGAPVALSPTAWGSWAVSTYAPTGARVDLVATFADGSTARASYLWPSATPLASANVLDATFANVTGNSWWVQADVSGSEAIASVSARVDGGAWVPLAKQWWGSWARSFYVAPGSSVQFQATGASGAASLSGTYPW
jgi:hypothetical protein